jgi:sulfide:quinone oxidoreductase
MVFMLETWLRRNEARKLVNIVWTTYENSFLQVFGPRLHEVVAGEFEKRSIFGLHNYEVENVTADDVIYKNGEIMPYDLLVSFPPYAASTPLGGLPSDERGFLQTNLQTRQVIGYPEIYAAGDAGDFPVKQAFLAFLQADAAAEKISCDILGKTPEFVFNPVSMCVMEQFDKATFAQVPLHLTGIKDKPIEVDKEKYEMYKVGSSPAWRLGKKLLGVYLPWRFNAGNPFHAGLPWKGMELGLKAMSGILAN